MRARRVLACVLLLLVAAVFSHEILWMKQAGEFKMDMKLCWFEVGLLKNYSIGQFMAVLNQFNFSAVMVMPWPWGQPSVDLIQACLDRENLTTFLIVGHVDFLDQSLVDRYKDEDIIFTIDDGTTSSQTNLQSLKDQGLKTALNHGHIPELKDIFDLGLVDYSLFTCYPVLKEAADAANWSNMQKHRNWTKEMKSYCTEEMKYVPWLQCYGLGAAICRFPTAAELRYMIQSVTEAKADGVAFFEPFTGESDRGETFDGFLDHPEVWENILSLS